MAEVEVRRLEATDADGFGAAVRAGREHAEFRGSSDPDGSFLERMFSVDPSSFGGAFAGASLIGLVSSEIKLTLVAPPFRRQGIGRRLVDLAEAMERDRGRPDVFMGLEPDNDPGRAFLVATGFTFHSTLWDLALPAEVAVAGPTWPAGVTARPFDRTRDVEAWVGLFNTAFADHATPLQLDPATVRASLNDPTLADADVLLLEGPDGALVGFCASSPVRTDDRVAPHAEIWTIGVRPEAQGRGLGRQLLRCGIGYLRSLGAEQISLSVNARNERALGLYEREGFVRQRIRERWARRVAAITAGPVPAAVSPDATG